MKLTFRIVFANRVVCEFTTHKDVVVGDRFQTPFTLSSDELDLLSAYAGAYGDRGALEVVVHR